MCTVTFWPGDHGYLLGMNRDEQRTRVEGLAPERVHLGARTVVHPREPGGGTWIASNDLGVTWALINRYTIPPRPGGPRRSRGGVVLAMRDAADAEEASRRLRGQDLRGVLPFRLMGFFGVERRVREWRWDQERLEEVEHGWQPRLWVSSGFDEPEARRIRSATFASRRGGADDGSVGWLRRLHASHEPQSGPFSVCMHRPDAVTVSYTEVEVTPAGGRLDYFPGSPCGAGDAGWRSVGGWVYDRVSGSCGRGVWTPRRDSGVIGP